MPLAALIFATVVLLRRAIADRVSPDLIVYVEEPFDLLLDFFDETFLTEDGCLREALPPWDERHEL